MNLTTFAFRRPKNAILWTDNPTRIDPADHPAWAVWETACGQYRIVFDGASDTFSPQRRHDTDNGTEWSSLSTDKHTLDEAQHVVERLGVHHA